MDVAHHDLGFGSVSQERNTTGFFDLIDDPVVVADRLQGDGCAFRELGEEGADGTRDVIDPSALHHDTFLIQDGEE